MNEKDIMIDVNHMSHIYTDENGEFQMFYTKGMEKYMTGK